MPTVNKIVRPWERRTPQKVVDKQHNADTGFYRRANWRKTRARVLEREPLCRVCHKTHKRLTPADMVDHIRPINLKGPETPDWYDENNLQPLCNACHAKKRSSERSSHRSRY